MAEEIRATTENVRETWAWIDNYPHEGSHSDWLAKDFDRWLTTVKADVWDEGARWGGVEFSGTVRELTDERQVQLAPGDNPYRPTRSSSERDE